MAKKKKNEPFKEVICPVCEKTFIPAFLHIYRDKRSPYSRVCSWGCVCKSERLKEANKQRNSRKQVVL